MKTAGIVAAFISFAASPVFQEEAPQAAPDNWNNQVVRGGALDTDCSHAGDKGYGYQFILTCPGRAVSPNGRFAIVQEPGERGGVFVADAQGRHLDDLNSLDDGMPFAVHWAPNGDRFFANHYLGSGSSRLRVFEIVHGSVVERSGVFGEASREIVSRYPCLGRRSLIFASGWKWSRDGRKIAMAVYARPDACLVQIREGVWEPDGEWEVLWMIGDAASGRILPSSVRVRPDGTGPIPADGPYSKL